MFILLIILIFLTLLIGIGVIISSSTTNNGWLLFMGLYLISIGLILLPIGKVYQYTNTTLSSYKKIMVENNIAEYNSEGEFVVRESE